MPSDRAGKAEAEKIRLPIICTCSDDGKQQAAKLLDDVKKRLHATDADLLTHIATSLNWDHDAHITSIANDMWSSVTVTRYDKTVSVYVECDQVEHGLAAAWNAIAARGGVTGVPDQPDDDRIGPNSDG